MYKKLKACPNNGVRCGKSSACFPEGTVCKEDRESAVTIDNDSTRASKPTLRSVSPQAKPTINNGTQEKVKNSTKAISWKAIVAGSTVIAVTGGSLLYLKSKKVTYPIQFEKTAAPNNLTPLNEKLDTSKLPKNNNAAEENQAMFEKKSTNLGGINYAANITKSDAAFNDKLDEFKNQSVRTSKDSVHIKKEEQEYTVNPAVEIYNKSVSNNKDYSRVNSINKIPYNEEQFRDNQREQKLYNHKLAREWAYNVLTDKDTVILDLETTSLMSGLDPYSPEAYRKVRANVPGIFQIGLVEANTHNSLDIKLNPERKLSNIAQEITGSDGKNLNHYANFKNYYPKLNKLLENKTVLAFNARFDMQVIDALCEENNLPLINYKNRPSPNEPMNNDADVMHWYALYMGKGARSDFSNGKYEPLTGLAYASLPKLPGQKAHDARSDCWSTLDVLRVMASGEKPRDMKVEEDKAWNKMMFDVPVKGGVKSSNINDRNSVNKIRTGTNGQKLLPENSSYKSAPVSVADTIVSNALSLSDESKKFKQSPSEAYDAYAAWGKELVVNTDVEPDINYSKTKRGSAEYKIKPLISDKELKEEKIRQKNLRQYINKYTKKADSIINEALS